MIEVKFRAWDGNNLIKDIHKHSDFNFHCMGNYKGYILMQYIGEKDKNNKEIYKGDINMDYNNVYSEVVFYVGGFYLKYSKTDYRHIGSLTDSDLMIIGNIYENPELLKESE